MTGLVGKRKVIHDRSGVGEIHSRHRIGGDQVDVAVRNLESGNDQTDSSDRKDLLLGTSDSLRDGHHVRDEVDRYVEPVVDLHQWHDQGMTRAYRIDRQEPDRLIVTMEFMSGQFTADDSCEHARHVTKGSNRR